MSNIPELDMQRVMTLIDLALAEDLDERGDTTSQAVIPADARAVGVLYAKSDCVLAGLAVAEAVFKKLDPECKFEYILHDGDFCPAKTEIARITGNAVAMLTAERTALNFIQRLCGVATMAHTYAACVKDSSMQVLDTRKTTPGWRNLEKYAVAVGGASNHRIGLFDRIMIKDNHREMAGMEGAGGILRSVERARKMYPDLEVEVEVDTLEELDEALQSNCEHILLDNMSTEMMAEAVRRNKNRAKLEASGNITIERLPEIAAIGVDFASSGALTHSVKSSDISLDIKPLK
ncbi:MAG: carboxylating nicotinate-nucleotide diphosphorylase [Lentisphaerae bacterium]|nr:carboxylating nicotinate-nucleotide diphosphorylase [Lentisphaerota bacterium]